MKQRDPANADVSGATARGSWFGTFGGCRGLRVGVVLLLTGCALGAIASEDWERVSEQVASKLPCTTCPLRIPLGMGDPLHAVSVWHWKAAYQLTLQPPFASLQGSYSATETDLLADRGPLCLRLGLRMRARSATR